MAGTHRGPLTEAEKAKIEQLHAEGMGRNAIAREIDRPWGTVTTYCRKHGLSFLREDALAGAEAKRRLAMERRSELSLALLDDVERLRESLFAPTKYVQYAGKDGDRKEDELPEPTAADKRNIAQAAMSLLDRSVKLDEYDRTGGHDANKSMLGDLFSKLGQAYGEMKGGAGANRPPAESETD